MNETTSHRGALGRLAAAIARRRSYVRTRRELGRLTDHELADIGISRFDIERIARSNTRAA